MRIIYYTTDTDIIIKPDTKFSDFSYDKKNNCYIYRAPNCRIDLTPDELKRLKQILAGVSV